MRIQGLPHPLARWIRATARLALVCGSLLAVCVATPASELQFGSPDEPHPAVGHVPPAVAHEAAPSPAGTASIRAIRGWREGDVDLVETVLRAVAGEMLSKFPGRRLAPITVSRSTTTPVALYERGPRGEYQIELTAAGRDVAGLVYEFAHEFCHVLSNYERHHEHDLALRHQWFEEALCEVASLHMLKTLAEQWQRAAPDRNLAAAAPAMKALAEQCHGEPHRRLPRGMTLASWYSGSRDQLAGSAYERGLNEVVANLLLPLFEKNPELWEAVEFLNLGFPGRTFRDHLQNWRDNVPQRHRGAIRHVMMLFFGPSGIGDSRPDPPRSEAALGAPSPVSG